VGDGANFVRPLLATIPMRYDWLDSLRGIAALWMIEVHVVDVALNPRWYNTWWFPWLSLTHGFVAVAFLFCAGGAFAITLERKLTAYRRWERPLWDYLAKLGLLLILGYWLHLPAFSLERTLHASPDELRRLADCDILQTIAACSLLALAIGMFTRRSSIYRSIYALLCIVFAALTPWVWESELFRALPFVVGAYIAPQPLSKFPLFPFAAYFFAGAVLVPFLRDRSNRTVCLIFGGSIALTLILMVIGFSSPKQWWHSSPEHVEFRIAGTLAALAALQCGSERIRSWKLRSFLRLAGQQSLWIYVFHLLIVYGSVGGHRFSALLGKSLDPAACGLLYAAVTLVTCLSARGWAMLKAAMPEVVRIVVIAVIVIAIVIFLVLPSRYAALLSVTDESVPPGVIVQAVVGSDPLR